jgi:transcriptional regulator with XRE-family HTH domain
MDFGTLLSGLMAERGLGVRALARHVPCDPALISRLASGRQQPSAQIARRLDEILGAESELSDLASLAPDPGPVFDDEIGAIEAARRAGATEVGTVTVERLEQVVDTLAVAYPSTAPAKLLSRTGAYLAYATGLLGRRLTLTEHRRLLVTSGWLSLLAATSLIDLRRYGPADAYLNTAMQMAGEAEHPELRAWCLETRAWLALSDGDHKRAVSLARGAQALAPAGSSALIQATAQEGRAWARLGDSRDTHDALGRVEALISPLAVPEHPEHHYRYDPAKAEAYVATTLSWVGDPAAVDIARSVLVNMESPADPRPRRAVAAKIDLALALAGAGKPDEAAGITLEAVASPYLVPSNYWRAEEVISVVGDSDPRGASRLRDAISGRHPAITAGETRA